MGVSKVGGCSTRPRGHLWFGPLFSFYFFSVLNHYFSTGFNFLTNFCFDSNLGNSDREARTECRIPSFSSLSTTFFDVSLTNFMVLCPFELLVVARQRTDVFRYFAGLDHLCDLIFVYIEFRSGSFSLYLLV